MKTLLFTLLIIICAPKATGVDYEVGVGVHQLNFIWIDDIDYKSEMLTLEATVWFKDRFGIKGQYGIAKDSSSKGTIYGDMKHLTEDFNSIQLVYRQPLFQRFSVETSVGYVSYTQGYYDADIPDYKGNDNDIMWAISINYHVSEEWKVNLGYNQLYQKDKGIQGKETLDSIGVTVVYKF